MMAERVLRSFSPAIALGTVTWTELAIIIKIIIGKRAAKKEFEEAAVVLEEVEAGEEVAGVAPFRE